MFLVNFSDQSLHVEAKNMDTELNSTAVFVAV